jgi:hypothetical protein
MWPSAAVGIFREKVMELAKAAVCNSALPFYVGFTFYSSVALPALCSRHGLLSPGDVLMLLSGS